MNYCPGGERPQTYEAMMQHKDNRAQIFYEDGIVWRGYQVGITGHHWLEKQPLRGSARFEYPSSRVADGEWLDGKLHGHGVVEMTGDVYRGQFVQGERHGHGELKFRNGCRYVGDFMHDSMHGKGQFYGKDGELVFSGTFRHNQPPEDCWWKATALPENSGEDGVTTTKKKKKKGKGKKGKGKKK